jgi:chromosome segregation ATPase
VDTRIYLDILFFHHYVYIMMKINIKSINIYVIITICLLIFIILCLKKTYLKENLQNITQDQEIVSIEATGINNVVESIDSTKQKEIMNVDYNNVIDRSDVNYNDGNILIDTYSELYPLRKEEVQLDNTLDEYKDDQSEIHGLKKKINEIDKKTDEIQVQMKTYNQVELDLQEAIAKNESLKNDNLNISSKTEYCNKKKKDNGTKIQSQENEIRSLKDKIKERWEIYQTTVKKEEELGDKFRTLNRRMNYLNQQSC